MVLLALLLADTVPSWVGIPTGIAGLGIPLGLWLRGTITLASDAKKQLVDKQEELSRVILDRDAWRAAHAAEVEARLSAEKASANLLDQTKVSNQLLDITKSLISTLAMRNEGVRND